MSSEHTWVGTEHVWSAEASGGQACRAGSSKHMSRLCVHTGLQEVSVRAHTAVGPGPHRATLLPRVRVPTVAPTALAPRGWLLRQLESAKANCGPLQGEPMGGPWYLQWLLSPHWQKLLGFSAEQAAEIHNHQHAGSLALEALGVHDSHKGC